jgi:hypothetical protein
MSAQVITPVRERRETGRSSRRRAGSHRSIGCCGRDDALAALLEPITTGAAGA